MNETDQNGQHYTKPHVGKSILERLWDQADEDYERADTMARGDHFPAEVAKVYGICRGLAIAIHMMAKPHYQTVDDVVKEIVRRRKQKLGEVGFEPTPGYKFNPPPPGTKVSQPPAERKQAGKQLSEQEKEGIKQAHASKMFDVPQLAQAYKVTTRVIKEVLDLT